MIIEPSTLKTSFAALGGGVALVFGVEPVFIYTLIGLSILDLVTGLIKAKITKKAIKSTPLTDGMLKKVLALLAVMAVAQGVASVDAAYQVSLTFLNMSMVMWFIGVEVKSNLENIQESGVLIPKDLSKKIDKAFNTNFTK